MDQRRITILGVIIMSLFAAAYYAYQQGYLLQTNDRKSAVAKAMPARPAAESIVYDFEQTTFTATGGKEYAINAKKVFYFAKSAMADMQQPEVYFFIPDKTAALEEKPSARQKITNPGSTPDQPMVVDWIAKADQGQMNESQDNLFLEGNVVVSKALGNTSKLSFSTSALQIHPRKQTAETSQAVTIRQGVHTTHSQGMKINIAAGNIELSSMVRSQYIPRQPQKRHKPSG